MPYIPTGTTKVVSPFFGGGSFELALAGNGIEVIGYDNFSPLVMFWHHASMIPERVANTARQFVGMDNKTFTALKKWLLENPMTLDGRYAATYFAVNRRSFNGLTFQMTGKISEEKHSRFTHASCDKLAQFPKGLPFTVYESDFETAINDHSDEFLFCDPPYMTNERLYGYKGDSTADFPHHRLAELLNGRSNWLLCYNNCEEVRELYANCTIKEVSWKQAHWGRGKNKKDKEKTELIITP